MTNAHHNFANRLLAWWDVHGRRDLPWQKNPGSYRVWVSEIMLQQTQVATVEGYFERFTKRFPSIAELAAASDDEVLHHWSGLGYYSRARNLHKAARMVMDKYGGELPQQLDQLVALPGIGRSTAGAILALSAGQRQPILDGNAKRVLARYFAVEGWPGTTANLKQLWALAEQCTPQQRVANYTQAIMDLGATLCRRSRPACDACPLNKGCKALATGRVASIPGARPKRARPRRSAVLLMARRGECVLLEKRPPQGIWGGLWSFPEFADQAAAESWAGLHLGAERVAGRDWPAVAHSFSHFDFDMQPLEVSVPGPATAGVMEGDGWLWYNTRSPQAAGLAAPVSRLLAEIKEPTSRES